MALVEVENLNVWMTQNGRETHVLRDVSFRVSRGERLAVIGESGSGKSTLLLALMGLLPPVASTAGRVEVFGVDVLGGPESELVRLRWRVASMVFQASSNPLNPVRSVGRQLAAVLRFHGCDRRLAPARVGELLAKVHLPAKCRNLYPHQLSGGMRQRAVIALALAGDPKLLLADEPTTALDPIVQAEIINLLLSLSGELGLALVLVSHDLQLVSRIGGRLAVMKDGRIVAYGPSAELMARPTHEHLRALIAALPNFGAAAAQSVPAQ